MHGATDTTLQNQKPTLPSAARWTGLLAGLVLTASPAWALNQSEAANNLMYFAFGMKQAEQCDAMGYPGKTAYDRWSMKSGSVLVQSMRAVEKYAAASGKVTPKQAKDVSLGLFIRFKDRYTQELAPKTGKRSCAQFSETLRFYETQLVRP